MASTLSTFNDADNSTNIFILLLQEPWITSNRDGMDFVLIIPNMKPATCATISGKTTTSTHQ